jgi:hypothetical protein
VTNTCSGAYSSYTLTADWQTIRLGATNGCSKFLIDLTGVAGATIKIRWYTY